MASRKIANPTNALTVLPNHAEYSSTRRPMAQHDQCESLIRLASKLAVPSNFHDGYSPGKITLPTNMLVFYRSGQLQSKTASCHHRHLLLLNLGHASRVVVDSHMMDMPSASATLIFPYQHHHYPDQGQEHLHRLFLTFEMPDDASLMPLRQRCVPLPQDALDAANLLCQWMPAHGKLPLPVHLRNQMTLVLGAILESVLMQSQHAHHVSTMDHPASSEARRTVQAVGRYLRDHRDKTISIDSLADHLAISPSHLRFLFKQEMRISLGRYIRQSKCVHAAALIDTSDNNLSQIANACGFTTLSAFSRCFTREVGISPAHYRSRNRQTLT